MSPELPDNPSPSHEVRTATRNIVVQNGLWLPRPLPQTARKLGFHTLRTKITLGYALAVAIPTVGVLTGWMVGNYHQREAIQALTTTYQENKLLNNLQVGILQNRPAKELTPYVKDALAFEQASDKIRARIAYLKGLVAQLEQAKTNTVVDFNPQLQNYKITLDTYERDFEILARESRSLQKQQDIDLLKKRILKLVNGDSFTQVLEFANQIDLVTVEVEKDIFLAQSRMQKAEVLKIAFILGSLATSIAIAIFLGIYTSQAIAHPVESLTKIAQQVTHEANMNLRAPVLTQDEIGTLANALNQLLHWVDTYTEELKNTQLHLFQAEKMSSLGQLVAGVAHEINNPVNFIHGNIEHLENYTQDLLKIIQAYQIFYPNPPEALQVALDEVEFDFLNRDSIRLLQSMRVGTERIQQIVLSLRNFSRLDESEFKAVDLHQGIDNTLLILQHRLKARSGFPGIEVIKTYGQLPLVECYPGQLNQVFMNLLANAIDVLEDSGQQPRKNTQELQPKMIWITTQVMPENQVQIAIADNGPGIPESIKLRLFDPFFTTKPVGKGTGLGLAISHQIVTGRHLGKIWCDSIPGEGTKFVVQIPIRQLAPVSKQ